ncbi:MAG TPA: GntR family transcriptional regulator [Blastocatellia bacterium]|nr:GntR family transcriptional regulator [Blastocatellia bacterium]
MTKPSSEFVTRKIPLYYQLENILREKIVSGAFAAGSRLPTESELIRIYGVGRITVRQALAALTKEGLIERKRRRGTFVTERKTRRRHFDEGIDLTGSLDEIIAAETGATFKVIEMNRIDADPQEAELFGLGTGAPLYRVKRLGLRDDKPRNLTINYLPAEIGEKLTPEELSAGSLLQTLETRFGLKLKSATQRITAAMADPYIAKLLDARVGSPMLSIERAVYAAGDAPVEFSQTLSRSDVADSGGYAIRLTRGKTAPQAAKSRKRKR